MLRPPAALAPISLAVAVLISPCPAQEEREPASISAARPTAIFDVERQRARRAFVTVGDDLPEAAHSPSPMLRELAGVVAELRARGLDDLRACVPPAPMLGDTRDAERLCVIHLEGRETTRRVGIYRNSDGAFIAVEMDAELPNRAELRKDAFGDLLASWPAYRGSFDPEDVVERRAEVVALPRPYVAGRYFIDEATLSARVLGGRKATIEGTTRRLEQEEFFVRLPRGYDPRRPAGLLVWVDSGPSGRPPEVFAEALDSLNIVCIGAADSGNARQVVTRYQLALDGVATASRRFHIDPRRVYISGLSGGGRVASMLQGCFPEVFTGAVPIVGLSSYRRVPTGTGGAWEAGFARPRADLFTLLQSRRIGAISGRFDANLLEMQNATELYQRDRVPVRLFEYPRMGHQLPKPEHFAEVMNWVDEPYRKARAAEIEAAQRALDVATSRGLPAEGPVPEAARTLLIRVTEAGPWTEPAWKAVELLARP